MSKATNNVMDDIATLEICPDSPIHIEGSVLSFNFASEEFLIIMRQYVDYILNDGNYREHKSYCIPNMKLTIDFKDVFIYEIGSRVLSSYGLRANTQYGFRYDTSSAVLSFKKEKENEYD